MSDTVYEAIDKATAFSTSFDEPEAPRIRVELGSLLLDAGWGLRMVNMPSVHTVMTGSILNKVVSQADGMWGKRWEEITPPSVHVGDIEHGWLTWTMVVGCLLRDLFPEPDSMSQCLFVAGCHCQVTLHLCLI